MQLTETFNLSSLSKADLSGLYRLTFNRLADPKLTDEGRRKTLVMLHLIRLHM